MARSRGRRYEEEPKLNMKKVFAVAIAIAVVIMFVFIIKGILKKGTDKGKITSENYYTMFKDNKWGVINSKGETIIDPSYAEMIVIPDNKKDVFICTYDVNYENGDYKTKALNSKNEQIFKEYTQIEALQNSDENNNLWYEANVLRVEKNGKYGLINLDGREILSCNYDEITAIKGISNSLKTKKDGKIGIANAEGKVIIENKFADIETLGNDDKSGFIVKGDDGKFGVVNYLGIQVLEPKYEKIEKVSGNDMYVIVEGTAQKLIDKDGKVILEQGYDKIKEILKNKENGLIFEKDGKFGVMNLQGEVKINPEYQDLHEAKDGILIAKKDDKYGIINLENEAKIGFENKSIKYVESADIYVLEDENASAKILDSNFEVKLTGIVNEINEDKGYVKMRIGEEYKYYNFKFEEKNASDVLVSNNLFLSKKDGKYGYVDKEGKVVVDYKYDDAKEQNSCGFAAVKKDGKWGAIDNKGNVAVEPTYNLDNYLFVDFIGKWHLGQDMNLNYYIQ